MSVSPGIMVSSVSGTLLVSSPGVSGKCKCSISDTGKLRRDVARRLEPPD